MNVELRAPEGGRERGAMLTARERWTFARMLREPVRDAMAIGGRSLAALVLGCGDGWLATELARLGLSRVLAVDSDATAVEQARAHRDALGYDAATIRIEPEEPPEIATESFGLVVVGEGATSTDGEGAALELARGSEPIACLILTSDRLATRERAKAAGLGRVSLLDPPADTERSFILRERCLLVARPPAGERQVGG